MSLFLSHARPILMYIVMALLVVHLAWNALASRRCTSWILLIGVVLLVLGVAAPLVHPVLKFGSRNTHNGSETWVPDEPYSTAVTAVEVIGALLVAGGLAAEIGIRVGSAFHDRGASREQKSET